MINSYISGCFKNVIHRVKAHVSIFAPPVMTTYSLFEGKLGVGEHKLAENYFGLEYAFVFVLFFCCCFFNNITLHEHLRAHKAVPYLGHSFLYCIDFCYEFHLQIINFV